jgi:DNA mismatch repair ATPase MutS
MGYLLKSYYCLYSNIQYEISLNYSLDFEGYVDNINGLYNHHINKHISIALFNTTDHYEFKKQYYPPLINDNPVKNDYKLNKNMIISSPNKGGKSTILKTTAINIIFTQQFGMGFYNYASISPFTYIHSYINIPDTSGRDSLFQAESRRCKEIIDNICNHKNDRHFCIFDELYSGTNPTEATLAGIAFLKYLESFKNVKFILTTHYLSICKKFKKSKLIQNYKMDVSIVNDKLIYKYKLKKGISNIKGGIHVLKDLDYPKEITNNI